MHARMAALLVGAAVLFSGAPLALAKPAHHQFSGEVSQIDGAAKTVVVKQKTKAGDEMTFSVGLDTKIMQGSRAKSLGELEIGERVKLTYADEGPKHVAKRIEVLPAKAGKTHASKKSTNESY